MYINNISFVDCQIMKLDKSRNFSFIIRGLQWTNVVERMFSVDTSEER